MLIFDLHLLRHLLVQIEGNQKWLTKASRGKWISTQMSYPESFCWFIPTLIHEHEQQLVSEKDCC